MLRSLVLCPPILSAAASHPPSSTSGSFIRAGSAVASAALAAASAALAAPAGKGTEAALTAFRQQQQQQAGDAYAVDGQSRSTTGGWRVDGVPVAMGLPVDEPTSSVNPLGSHPPMMGPPLTAPPTTTTTTRNVSPHGSGLLSASLRDSVDPGTTLVPEQQFPLFNAGQLFYIERTGDQKLIPCSTPCSMVTLLTFPTYGQSIFTVPRDG